MSVRDHSTRRRPPRVRWFLTIFVSFTAGVVAAASLFAYSSRIPIPIKISPTRGADNILSSEPEKIEEKIEFQERLETRVIENNTDIQENPAPVVVTQEEIPEAKPDPDELMFFVQAGAFSEQEAAQGLYEELNGIGMPTSIREASDSTADSKLFRVVVGPFDNAAATERIRAELALTGRSSTVLRLAVN